MTSQTKLYFLSIYQATPGTPLETQTADQLLHRGRIQRLNINESDAATTLLSDQYMPDGIAISQKHGQIFWTNMGSPGKNDGSVYTANLDGSNPRPIIPSGGANTPKQIVLESQSEKLYFCDREGLRVHRCNLDGSQHEVIVQTGDWQDEAQRTDQTKWCVGIAISLKQGKIFWSQKGSPKSGQGRIFSANVDMPSGATASSRPDIEVVASGLPEPIDLEVDDETDTIYWTDRGEFPFGNTLNRKTLSGQPPFTEEKLGRQVLAEGFGEAIGLALDKKNDCAWVADLCGRIWKCDISRPAAKEKVYESETSVLTGLAVLHA